MTNVVTDLRPFTLDDGGSFALERRWVAYREDPVDGGRLAKVPYTPDGKRYAATDRYQTWGTRAEAETGARLLHTEDRKSGVGIVLGAHRTFLGGIDLDTCFAETGELLPWAANIVNALPTYWEISINGGGLHGLFRYRAEDRQRLRDALKKHGKSHTQASDMAHKPGAATYLEGRYFTVSENRYPGSTETIKEASTDDLLQVISVLAPAVAGAKRKKRDETRSGWAYRLAVKTVAFNKGKRSFLEALYEDPDGAAWADENCPWNEDGAWAKANAKYGWMREWQRHKNGSPLCNLDNVLQAMRYAEELAGLFGYDEMRRTETLLKPLPNSTEAWTGPRPVRDVDVTAVQEWLQENWLVTVSKETTFQAAALCAFERPFHPVRDYLKRLEWDGVDRLDDWLAVYLGAERSAYTAAIGRMFPIAMVARIFRPGCQVDYMMVLEGPQGPYKSSACRVLAGDDFFSDSMPDIRDERIASEHLAGKWLIEISELSAFSKSESARLKAFLTQREEQYIKRYGRKEVVEKRQCCFIGTTNESAYLRDATGGRRFWPVVTGRIDIEALRHDRDQLLAEAVARFQRDEKWWPDRDFEATHIKPQQDARFEQDPWESVIEVYLSDKLKTTVQEVATALNVFTDRLHPGISKRIVAILRRLGYVEKRTNVARVWVFDL